MFFLDVSPEEAYRRIRETRGEREMFEGLDELRFVRRKALSLLSMGGWVVVDGDKPPDSVEEEIRVSLKLRL
jgi:thymidylate kinase